VDLSVVGVVVLSGLGWFLLVVVVVLPGQGEREGSSRRGGGVEEGLHEVGGGGNPRHGRSHEVGGCDPSRLQVGSIQRHHWAWGTNNVVLLLSQKRDHGRGGGDPVVGW
jgi:hypothetical protein